ncbi:MAG: hypothetical protein ACRDTG_03890 [Pseudonocardiaceae bacterium]
MTSTTRRAIPLLLGATLPVVALVSPASAAPPPAEPTPTQCLNEFSSNPDYVGDGWVGARVSGPPSGNPFDLFEFFNPQDREYSLFCGDELSGVVHIAHPESTGTVHPISPDDEEQFLMCWRRTIAGGDPEPDVAGRTRFVLEYREGEFATAIVDNERRFTYTLFTSTGAEGNDWSRCVIIRGGELNQ